MHGFDARNTKKQEEKGGGGKERKKEKKKRKGNFPEGEREGGGERGGGRKGKKVLSKLKNYLDFRLTQGEKGKKKEKKGGGKDREAPMIILLFLHGWGRF